MFITLFVKSHNKSDAINFSKNFLELAKGYTIKASITHLESYWKINNIHKIHIESARPDEDNLKGFLDKIATRWIEYPNELITSRTVDDCIIHIEKLEMITIEFDE